MEAVVTHNAQIYHCQTCGRIERSEWEFWPPQCRRHTMREELRDDSRIQCCRYYSSGDPEPWPESGATTSHARHEHAYTPNGFISEDKRQRKLDILHNAMYDEVLDCGVEVNVPLIFRRGEAKSELNKHI